MLLMGIEIEIINEQEIVPLTDYLDKLKQVLLEAATVERIEIGEVVVTIVTDDEIHGLNRQYRHIDRPTDVLSFAMLEELDDSISPIHHADVPVMLGDIIISAERAVDQAEDYGHSVERELCFLAVHGFLHLIGYDHDSEETEQHMFQKQEMILERVGVTR